jgi:phytoene desaturase
MSFYVQNASATDSTLAPSGRSTIYVLVPVPDREGNIDWTKEKAAFREKVIRKIEAKTVMKDIRQNIETERIITPEDWENEYSVFKGGTFNLSHKIMQMLYFRPRNQFEEIKNCYLTGGGTHPGSGLPTIYESARISSNLISKKYGVPFNKPSGLESKKAVG